MRTALGSMSPATEAEASEARLKRIVGKTLEMPASERAEYLEAACGGDRQLRSEARSLLGLEDAAAGFLSESPMRPDGAPLDHGHRLGSYRILRALGSGGMGDVYLAERSDGAFEQQVAVKVIRAGAGLDELFQRFLSERQLLAELKHPNIANLVDGGTTGDGRPYLVLEYVNGQPIDDFCRAMSLSIEQRLSLFLKVCAAVQYAHRHLVVHRDLKPSNILVTSEGEPKLLDFGVAKDLGGAGKTPETRLLVPVTPEYASPEQLTGQATTTAVDVYALGVVLYELLANCSPFDGRDPLGGRSESSPPEPASTRVPGRDREARRLRRRLCGDLDHIVLRALAPDPAERYATVEQLQRDLERHLDGLALETRVGTFYRLGRAVRRNWTWLAALAVALGAGGLWLDESLERRQLERETQRVTQLSEGLGHYLEEVLLSADPQRTGERSKGLEKMLKRGAELLDSETLAEEPVMRAELLSTIGQVYRRLGLPSEAEPLLRESLALRSRHLPPGNEWIAVSCNNLAMALRDLGAYGEARNLFRAAHDSLRRIRPPDHPQIATAVNNLAGVEKDLGLFDEAIEHYREALDMKRRQGRGNAVVVNGLKNLGSGLRAAGRLDEAEAAFRQALAELSRAEEPEIVYRAGAWLHLGAVLRERGDLEAARELLERARATRVELYGEDHKKAVETLLELALLDQREGRLEVAEEKLRAVVEVRRGRLGSEHPSAAAAIVHLARLLAERGEAGEAAALVEEAIGIFGGSLPAGHWRTAEAEEFLAGLGRSSR